MRGMWWYFVYMPGDESGPDVPFPREHVGDSKVEVMFYSDEDAERTRLAVQETARKFEESLARLREATESARRASEVKFGKLFRNEIGDKSA